MNTETTSPYSQYKSLKAKHPDAIILFRNGSFYNVFQEDARTAAQVLGVTTYVENSPHNPYFWAGFPSSALDIYLPKLIRAGHRVAICDLIEAHPPRQEQEAKQEPPAYQPPSYDLFANDW